MRKLLKWGYVDKEGNFAIEPVYDGARDFHDGLAAVKKDWARGFIDRSGQYAIEPQYQKVSDFHSGAVRVELDGRVSYINKEGVEIDKPEGWTESFEVEKSHIMPLQNGDKIGYADNEGTMVIAAKYVEAEPFHEGLARVKTSASGKWSYIDEKGKVIIKGKFIQAKDFSEGLAAVLVEVKN